MSNTFLYPTQEAGRAFINKKINGPVVMLNLLKFRDRADYSDSPGLAPVVPVSGAMAYQAYMEHTMPFLEKSGGAVVFFGNADHFLIGPLDEKWDAVLLIRQNSVDDFIAFASDEAYLSGTGHRTAALEDSRLLPMVETVISKMKL